MQALAYPLVFIFTHFTGIYILGVDIEGADVKKIYPNYVKFDDMRTLVRDMRKLVAKALRNSHETEVM